MSRSRAYRRHQAQRVSQKRMDVWGRIVKSWKDDPKQLGRMRKSNFGCGCKMCKPHKYFNKDSRYASIQQLRWKLK